MTFYVTGSNATGSNATASGARTRGTQLGREHAEWFGLFNRGQVDNVLDSEEGSLFVRDAKQTMLGMLDARATVTEAQHLALQFENRWRLEYYNTGQLFGGKTWYQWHAQMGDEGKSLENRLKIGFMSLACHGSTVEINETYQLGARMQAYWTFYELCCYIKT